jgi:cob(I)alamin adenosyltransferase
MRGIAIISRSMGKIYTRTGDDGGTGLGDGSRVRKDALRVEAYGEVDELNASIGVARGWIEDREMASRLEGIQRDLFALGAQLSNPKYDPAGAKEKTKLTEERIREFEGWIDGYTAHLPSLKGFILPAGTKSGAALHLVRTICRRAERRAVELASRDVVRPLVLTYLNRLSDLLFVMARVENQAGGEPQVGW